MAGKPQLGAATEYPTKYEPELLVSIPRAQSRSRLPADVAFHGADLWTAYELSWLDARGKPCVAIGEFEIDCRSPAIVESKSFKLYLNSFNQERLASQERFRDILVRDLSAAFGAPVAVTLMTLDEFASRGLIPLAGDCIDDLPVSCDPADPDAALLAVEAAAVVEETLHSHLLKSNCPVTGQPDWASIVIRYRGQPLQRESLLRYLVAFRGHQDFHENCVERIFCDIAAACEPECLSVYARYTRRGGLDINPFRSTEAGERPAGVRTARQ